MKIDFKNGGTVAGIVSAIFAMLQFFSIKSSPLFWALVSGIIVSVLLIRWLKWTWSQALVTLFIMGLLLFSLDSLASRPANVIGAVIDNSGVGLKDLQLTLIDVSGVEHKTVTGDNGSFVFLNVPTGKFDIKIEEGTEVTNNIPSGWLRLTKSEINIGTIYYERKELTNTIPPSSSFPWKIDGSENYDGVFPVKKGQRYVIVIGDISLFYSKPSLNYDADINVASHNNRKFFRALVINGEELILCIPENGTLSIGESINENVGGDLRELECP